MRRWNGWGDTSRNYPMQAHVAELLAQLVGAAIRPHDVAFEAVLQQVPAARLPAHALVHTTAEERVRHACGQSFADLIALRSGQIAAFPDGVAYPLNSEDVRQLINYAREHQVRLIPYGGGTSVVGHVNPLPSDTPVLTVDLSRMNRLLHLDAAEHLAHFGAGVAGPDLEAQLRVHGYTLGHFPQSFEYSTLGGWIATRSSGQQSLGFGRIEQLWAGGHVETPAGSLTLPPFPASAAGPDLRELVLGSEGRLGIITEATVRVRPLPQRDDVHAVFFPTWEAAQQAVQALVQARIPLSMLRLSTARETMTTLALAGHRRLINILEHGLALRQIKAEKCLLLIGFMGHPEQAALSRKHALEIARKFKGVHLGKTFGKQWQKGRFRAPYLRNTLWEAGYGVDTVETATTWHKVPLLLTGLENALFQALPEAERVHVYTHLSHVYPTGSSIYTTFVFRLGRTTDETVQRWQALKRAASLAIVAHGGTISHQHGVGLDHRPYLVAEKGPLGIQALEHTFAAFDPTGLMNPGKLISKEQTDVEHTLA